MQNKKEVKEIWSPLFISKSWKMYLFWELYHDTRHFLYYSFSHLFSFSLFTFSLD